MSILKYTLKYLLLGGLFLIVIGSIGTLLYRQIQKNDHEMEDHADTFRPSEVQDSSTSSHQSLWDKVTPRLKKKPRASHSHGHLHPGDPPPPIEYPRDLKERLDKVEANGNSIYTNPNFFQELYDAVSDGRDMETTIEILKEYGIYTDVVLEHMDSYEAFKYTFKAPDNFGLEPSLKYAKRVINEDPSSAEALEAAYLRGWGDDFLLVMKHQPDSPLLLYKWGNSLLSAKRPAEAIVYLKKALQTGLGQKALQMGQEQLRHSPDTVDRLLSIAYQQLGDYKSAWVHLKKVESLNPSRQSWARGHLELIASGDPYILPLKREPISEGIVQDTTLPPVVDTPVPSPEVFVDAFVVPEDVPLSPQVPEGLSPDEIERQDVEHQAFLELLRKQEEFARRLAEEEQFKTDYFREVQAFIQWAESIENDAPIDTNDFLAKEMERHLLGEKTRFAPDRIKRGFDFIQKYGQTEGIQRLQQLDPSLANRMTQLLHEKQVPPRHPRDK